MSGLWILAVSAILLLAAYFIYGGFLCKLWGVDPNRVPPSISMQDGIDYVPAPKSVLFGHQFASIAGAGPINGPIMAAMFGWVPVLAWIILGGIFFGAVQDFSALYTSVRNQGKSLGHIIEMYVGKTGKTLFLLFVWLFCVLIIAAFGDIVAATFNGFKADGGQDVANAATASTSVLFIFSAVLFAGYLRLVKSSSLANAVIAVAVLCLCIWLGVTFPFYLSKGMWMYLVFGYIFVAAVLPVWILLQPRDYLNSYLLLAMIGAACLGIVFSNPTVNLPAFSGFVVNGQYLFPILFVTVACGAVSGFHSLVSAGTTSKQISNEADMRLIGFGSMLFESLLAVIALIAVGALYTNNTMPSGTPPVIFANAVAGFLGGLGIPADVARTLITLAVSAFALTSLDSVARIGRLAFQELVTSEEKKSTGLHKMLGDKYVATLITLVLGYLLAIGGYQNIWPLFGSSNQLLASLSLIAVCVYMKRTGKNGSVLYIPMIFMLIVTFAALILTTYKLVLIIGTVNFMPQRDLLQLVFALLLMGLAAIVAVQCFKALRVPSAGASR